MSNVHTATRNLLLSYSSITNQIGAGTSSRLWTNALEQGTALPAVVLSHIFTRRYPASSGTTRLAQAKFQVDCYAADPDTAAELAKTIRTSGIGTYRGTTSGIWFSGIAIDGDYLGDDPDSDGSADRRFISSFTLEIDYTEAS